MFFKKFKLAAALAFALAAIQASAAFASSPAAPVINGVDTPAYVLHSENQATFTTVAHVSEAGGTYTVGFAYSPNGDPETTALHDILEQSVVFSAKDMNLSATAYNLVPELTYYLRAYVKDANGQPVYSSSYVQFSTKLYNGGGGSPTGDVVTEKANYNNTYIDAAGYAYSSANGDITEKGFVYSPSTSSPRIGEGDTRTYSVSSGVGPFSASISVNWYDYDFYYYVAAYARYSNGQTAYGSSIRVSRDGGGESPSGSPAVFTESITNVGDSDANVDIYVSSDGSSQITRRGVVYSAYTSTPTVDNSEFVSISGTTGSGTAYLSGLSANTRYYARAFATNSYGTGYGAVETFTTSSGGGGGLPGPSGSPSVSTEEITRVTEYSADVSIYVSSEGGAQIIRRGVVYSASVNSPTISDSGIATVSGYTGQVLVPLDGLASNTRYYARAFATNSYGTSYGAVKTFTTSGGGSAPGPAGSPTVSTEDVANVGDYGAEVGIYVSSAGSGQITDRGVVFSSATNSPSITNSGRVTVPGTTGRAAVTLSGLTAQTKYYARAFATNSYGTSYGAVKEFVTSQNAGGASGGVSTGDSAYSETREVRNASVTSVAAYGYADTRAGRPVAERGFVYSRFNQAPTLSDTKAADSQKSTGNYSMTLTGLLPDTVYYLRAFTKIGAEIFYGRTIEFVTGIELATLNIIYQTTAGINVGVQSLSAANGTTLTAGGLSLPAGYTIADSAWQHKVFGNETIAVYVREPSAPSGSDTGSSELPFMAGTSGGLFQPDSPITRRDTALILYNLSDKTTTGTPRSFPDIEGDSARAALEYVTSENYMTGYPDGLFKPDGLLTRTEIAVVMCNFYGLTGSASCDFADLGTGFWGYPYIALAVQAGSVSGYPDNTFRPENMVTRAEAATLFVKMERRSLQPIGSADFPDVPATHWAYKYIMNAAMAVK
ncbi:MAG: S-layer homology domain-containing protein [Clostridiales bacterium]|jgi:hypothetical protein|nr:S-layer homology domain-containing protein [Clostridiales bacterium]